MIRTHTGQIIKINKSFFSSEKEYYQYYIKQKYNVEFVKETNESLSKKIVSKIKNRQKNYSS